MLTTIEEQVELTRLAGEIDTLDAELDANGIDHDPRWSTRDDLEAAYDAVRQAGRYWAADTKALAGVILSVGNEGRLVATEGVIRIEDQKRVDALLKHRRGEGSVPETRDESDLPEDDEPTSALPKAVNRDLPLERTRAIRLALSTEPNIALALCVAAMAHRALHQSELIGVAIAGHVRQVDDFPGLDGARVDLAGRMPNDEGELLDWALDLSRERLLAVLAILVAGAVDLTHDDASFADRRKQALADRLSLHLDIDMTQFWKPDLSFWVRLPKSALMAALAQAPGLAGKSHRARADAIKAHAKFRKDDLAARIASLFEGSDYIPEILVTPAARGALELTTEGLAAIEHPAVAAE